MTIDDFIRWAAEHTDGIQLTVEKTETEGPVLAIKLDAKAGDNIHGKIIHVSQKLWDSAKFPIFEHNLEAMTKAVDLSILEEEKKYSQGVDPAQEGGDKTVIHEGE